MNDLHRLVLSVDPDRVEDAIALAVEGLAYRTKDELTEDEQERIVSGETLVRDVIDQHEQVIGQAELSRERVLEAIADHAVAYYVSGEHWPDPLDIGLTRAVSDAISRYIRSPHLFDTAEAETLWGHITEAVRQLLDVLFNGGEGYAEASDIAQRVAYGKVLFTER
jgi:hypothetical protein